MSMRFKGQIDEEKIERIIEHIFSTLTLKFENKTKAAFLYELRQGLHFYDKNWRNSGCLLMVNINQEQISPLFDIKPINVKNLPLYVPEYLKKNIIHFRFNNPSCAMLAFFNHLTTGLESDLYFIHYNDIDKIIQVIGKQLNAILKNRYS